MGLNASVIKNSLSTLWKSIVKNAPTLAVIFGTGLMAAAPVKTAIEAPKAKEELEELDERDDISHKEYLKDKTIIIVRRYGIPVLMVVSGGVMIFIGYRATWISMVTGWAALASKTEEFDKLESKVIEKVGPKEYEKIQDEIAKEDVLKNPVNYATVVNTGHGNTLCLEPVGGTYFWSDLDYIRKQIDRLNKEMTMTRWNMCKATCTYDEYREMLDLPALDGIIDGKRVAPAIGRDLGWKDNLIEMKHTCVTLPDDTVCHVIGFTRDGGPRWYPNIGDLNGEDISRDELDTDDETDMPWRT